MPRYMHRLDRDSEDQAVPRPIVTISPGTCGTQTFDISSAGGVSRPSTQVVADIRVLGAQSTCPALAYARIEQAVRAANLTDYGRTELDRAIRSSLTDDPDFDFRVLSNEAAEGIEGQTRARWWDGQTIRSHTMVLYDPTSARSRSSALPDGSDTASLSSPG